MMPAAATRAAVRLDELLGASADSAAANVLVTDITTHSAQVAAGGLFMACQGAGGHGLQHLQDALARQPAAIVWEPSPGLPEPALPAGVVGIRVPGLGAQVGTIADRFFGRPSTALSVSGVTGTNGKTTTSWLVSQALNRLGQRAGYMGTLGYGVGTKLQPTTLTTPGCIVVHRRLREMAEAGAVAVCMEVSSHALDQGRIDGVRLRTAAFTNLSRDHLDYHGSLQAYKDCKARLFAHDGLEAAVINVGDEFGQELVQRCNAARLQVLTVAAVAPSEVPPPAALTVVVKSAGPDGMQLEFQYQESSCDMATPLWGGFNVENLLVAAGMLLTRGLPLPAVLDALSTCTAPPGRMQRIPAPAGAPLVVVDFAHTPDALQKALLAMRAHCDGSLWVVFGCGGERDAGKRAAMGAVAAMHADRAVLTSDNPRSEDPLAIIAAIRSGMPATAAALEIPDRARAIAAAIAAAGPRDGVLIAGKGSESLQYIGDRTEPFSDADVAAALLGQAA